MLMSLFLLCFGQFTGAESYGELNTDAEYSVQALWHLESLSDETANNNDLTIQGQASLITGKFGQAYNLDGINDHLTADDHASISGLSAVTLTYWVNFDAFATTGGHVHGIVAKSNYADNREYRMRLERDRLIWHVSSDGTDPGADETEIDDSLLSIGVWYFLAGTYDSATNELNLYLDAVLMDTVSYTSSGLYDGSAKLGIGAYGDGGDANKHLDAQIDEVTIFNRALSSAEIRAIYAMQMGAYGVIE